MNSNDQIIALESDLNKLIDRYRAEFEMPYAAVVGVLQLKVVLLCNKVERKEEE